MSAVAIVRAKLIANAALIAVIPAAKIFAGVIPLSTVLPAITITEISSQERNGLAMNAPTIIAFSRVQVSVLVKTSPEGGDYATLKSALELVRLALPNVRATVAGFAVDSIRPDITGPELEDTDLRILSQSKDFMVQFYVSGA